MQVLENVTAHLGEKQILTNVSLSIQDHAINCLLGPSGCGKSTLLRVAAGLLPVQKGKACLNPSSCAIVFQEPRLLPWLTIAENLSLAIKHQHRKEKNKAITHVLSLMQLHGIEKYMPTELSGGMAQRVGIARAFLRSPEVLLMDEPFAALDAITRSDLQQLLLTLIAEQETTCLFVTHDIHEATVLGEHIFMMHHGSITQEIPCKPFHHAKDKSILQKQILKQLNAKEFL